MQIIGLGLDLVPVARIASLLSEHRERFLERTFTPIEQAECGGSRREAERFASRFAAKEAVLKALGTGLSNGISLVEIGVVSLPSGQPTMELTGVAARVASEKGVKGWLLSLTDTSETSAAVAIAIG